MSCFEGIERRPKENVACFFNECLGHFRLNEKSLRKYIYALERGSESCSEERIALTKLITMNKDHK